MSSSSTKQETTRTSTDAPRNSTDGTRASSDVRRSSGMFANLQQYKRDDSEAYTQRRSSVADQTAQKHGFIGGMFDKFVRGEHPAEK